jgi:hypothetical protein
MPSALISSLNQIVTMITFPYLALAASLFGSAVTAPSPIINHVDEFVRRDAAAPPFVKRAASCTFPTPPKTSSLSAPITVTGTFDGLLGFLALYALISHRYNPTGGNVRFDRGSGACTDQAEGGDSDAVFLVQSGGTVQ